MLNALRCRGHPTTSSCRSRRWSVAAELNRRGYKTPYGETEWSPATAKLLLDRAKLTGSLIDKYLLSAPVLSNYCEPLAIIRPGEQLTLATPPD
jgi:hypothetical protein